jgi:hypothetical protein
MENNKQDNKKKVWLIRLLVFVVLFIFAEIGLRIAGHRPGVLIRWADIPANAVNDSLLYGDQYGITHYVKGGYYKPDGVVNDQGFIGTYNYDSATITKIRTKQGKKIVMAIGDSFLDGCCSDSMANSFAGLLSKKNEYAFLNFGIGGADPLQYKLIVEHYAPQLKPDLIVVNFFVGNDIMTYDRTPKPLIPNCYVPVGLGHWLNAEPPYHLAPPNYVLKDFDTAIEFYHSWYTLKGKKRGRLIKWMGNSVLFSKLYLGIEYNWKRFKMRKSLYSPPPKPQFSYKHLKFIKDYCDMNNIPYLLVVIPTAGDVIKKVDLKAKYSYVFNELEWSFLADLEKNDYDGVGDGNHFNNRGHKKYADFLNKLVLQKLSIK